MGFTIVDLGELCFRVWRGSPGAPGWSPRCAGCSRILAISEGAAALCLLDQYTPLATALERSLWPGVDRSLSKLPPYGQFYFFLGAMDLALVTFAVEKMIAESVTFCDIV
jgi:hypothetical protein